MSLDLGGNVSNWPLYFTSYVGKLALLDVCKPHEAEMMDSFLTCKPDLENHRRTRSVELFLFQFLDQCGLMMLNDPKPPPGIYGSRSAAYE